MAKPGPHATLAIEQNMSASFHGEGKAIQIGRSGDQELLEPVLSLRHILQIGRQTVLIRP